MLECNDLIKIYNKKPVVNQLSFEVKQGEVFALLGSNGAGKTTTIKMILGLVAPNSGTISRGAGIRIGYSPETPYFPPFLTGLEVMLYYAGIQKIEKKQAQRESRELLERVGLEDDKTKIKHYSKGMLQRLALAQALLGEPDVLILDEPTAGLDAMGRLEIINLIGRLNREQGKTILINSHILNDIERICDRGIIIKKGKLVGTWDRQEDYGEKTLEELFVEMVGGMER